MSFKVNFAGLDELERKLKSHIEKVSNLGKNVPFTELFDEKFMSSNTKFDNIQSFADASKFDFENLDSIDEKELDQFVDSNTDFNNWEDMKNRAAEIWVKKQLDL
ncbi:hypothetical protein WJ437_09105 [Ignavigranum ruoffiae]|uniref:hypothetical protein n=1 Tax=Ignavigranum ruoffiae TaxID=89093 RepID=UPI00235411A6|nr:hypothetical protein [Ignavigranum ruoffiae]